MTGTYKIEFDLSGFGIAALVLTNAEGREIAVLEFVPGKTITYLQPGQDIDLMADHNEVLQALLGK